MKLDPNNQDHRVLSAALKVVSAWDNTEGQIHPDYQKYPELVRAIEALRKALGGKEVAE